LPLLQIEIAIDSSALPDHVQTFLLEADSRVNQFLKHSPIGGTGFIACDFQTVYRALQAITNANLAAGTSLCEWGSGFGVVASLAEMQGFSSSGIEVEEVLVDASRTLADDFSLSVHFVHGSFIPTGAEEFVEETYADSSSEFSWLVTDADNAYDELGHEPEDFDIIFAYPWPGGEGLIESLFEKCAAEGALLLLYDQYDSVRLLRKVGAAD
jgi:hypothetical protein